MFASTKFLIAAVVSLAGMTTAVPTGTHNVEARSYVSAGVACYFQCPTIADLTFEGLKTDCSGGPETCTAADTSVICSYATTGAVLEQCEYSEIDGSQVTTGSITNNAACPTALDAICGAQPGDSFKKRSTPRPKKARNAAIDSRQYNPKKARKVQGTGSFF